MTREEELRKDIKKGRDKIIAEHIPPSDFFFIEIACKEAELKGIQEGKQDVLRQVEEKIAKPYCNNCRFACQATECECICHSGWIKREELKQSLKEIK